MSLYNYDISCGVSFIKMYFFNSLLIILAFIFYGDFGTIGLIRLLKSA